MYLTNAAALAPDSRTMNVHVQSNCSDSMCGATDPRHEAFLGAHATLGMATSSTLFYFVVADTSVTLSTFFPRCPSAERTPERTGAVACAPSLSSGTRPLSRSPIADDTKIRLAFANSARHARRAAPAAPHHSCAPSSARVVS